jgi:hypothetical protein
MKKIFLLQQIYWLSWVAIFAIWHIGNITNLRDIRIVPFTIGLILSGYAIFVLLPFAVRDHIVLYRKTERNSKILLLIEFGLWSLCSVLFGIFIDLYEKALFMMFIDNVEMNNLPGFSVQLLSSLFSLSIGNAIGFYGINQGYFRFNILRTIVSMFFFFASIIFVREL